MRSICRVAFFTVVLGALAPTFAFGQQFQFPDPDDVPEPAEAVEAAEGAPPPEPQQSPRRNVYRGRRSWRNSPIVWTGVAVALAVALPFGVYRVIAQMRYASQQMQKREKAPWERDA
jgi:hypothetical protein